MSTKTRPRSHRDRRMVQARYPLDLVHFCVEGDSEQVYITDLIQHSFGDHLVAKFLGSRHQSSLKNLVNVARRQPDRGDEPVGTWIVCDADENGQHWDALQRWASTDPAVRLYAITNPCLEYWLILHFSSTANCLSADAARKELVKYLPGYKKGGAFPVSVFDNTPTALSNERCRNPELPTPDRGWPAQRSSQMPDLIDWLGQRAADHARR